MINSLFTSTIPRKLSFGSSKYSFAIATAASTKKFNREAESNASAWEAAGERGKTLVIVESPAKAKTITKFLDNDKYVVDFSSGHIRQLATGVKNTPDKLKKEIVFPKFLSVAALGVDVHNDFEPIYVAMDMKHDIISRLKKHASKCSRILLATDEDREGEAISWHLLEVLKPKVPYMRAVFHEITESAILEAFKSPRHVNMDLVHSQETRRILDRLTGFTITPLLWNLLGNPKLSAGRVQSCGLHLISAQEQKRWAFVESNYFSIIAGFSNRPFPILNEGDSVFEAKLASVNGFKVAGQEDFDGTTGKLKTRVSQKTSVLDESTTTALLERLTNSPVSRNAGEALASDEVVGVGVGAGDLVSNLHTSPSYTPLQFKVQEIDEKMVMRAPPKPFITSTLQQESSKQLGLSPAMTMSVAQVLYEEGYITYMRTDSPHLSQLATNAALDHVKKYFGAEYVGTVSSRGAGQKPSASKPSAFKPGDRQRDGEADTDSGVITKVKKETDNPKNAQGAFQCNSKAIYYPSSFSL